MIQNASVYCKYGSVNLSLYYGEKTNAHGFSLPGRFITAPVVLNFFTIELTFPFLAGMSETQHAFWLL